MSRKNSKHAPSPDVVSANHTKITTVHWRNVTQRYRLRPPTLMIRHASQEKFELGSSSTIEHSVLDFACTLPGQPRAPYKLIASFGFAVVSFAHSVWSILQQFCHGLLGCGCIHVRCFPPAGLEGCSQSATNRWTVTLCLLSELGSIDPSECLGRSVRCC
mmetsp:Transcript_8290/g.51631  ORF Transcript_8290/g.51631 Transcript_8290/m.51631 type:complete len:160 (+) Transcript_8290:212-691(+)